jgi:hypothetical protein
MGGWCCCRALLPPPQSVVPPSLGLPGSQGGQDAVLAANLAAMLSSITGGVSPEQSQAALVAAGVLSHNL